MPSKLEYKFYDLWTNLHPSLILEEEYKFCLPRRYRADFAHVASKVLIEIQGGVWVKSKHSSGVGINRDCEKLFLAASNGFVTFQLTSHMIDAVHIDAIASTIRMRRRQFSQRTKGDLVQEILKVL